MEVNDCGAEAYVQSLAQPLRGANAISSAVRNIGRSDRSAQRHPWLLRSIRPMRAKVRWAAVAFDAIATGFRRATPFVPFPLNQHTATASSSGRATIVPVVLDLPRPVGRNEPPRPPSDDSPVLGRYEGGEVLHGD
jgi:hypothetical protein